MNEHDEIRQLLPLAAAGALTPEEQRRLEAHSTECESCEAEFAQWQTLAETLAAAPTPSVPEGLLERTRNRIVAEQANRRERLVGDIVLGFVMLFGWTLTLVGWLFWKLLTGGSLLEISLQGTAYWLGGSTLVAWVTAGVAIVLLASRRRLLSAS